LIVAGTAIPLISVATDKVVEVYPIRPVRLVVGQPPGDGADIIARHLAAAMSEDLGQKIVIENRPGAAGNIAAAAVSHDDADGYLFFLAARPVILHKKMYRDIKYDFSKDFVPVGMAARFPYVLVMGNHVAATSLLDAIAYGKSNPEKLTCGSGGIGSTTHLLCEMVRESAGLPWMHVPYTGDSPALMDVIGGRSDFCIVTAPSVLPFIAAGTVRAMAVFAPDRVALIPGVPTIAEYGFRGADAQGWFAVMAPRGTPSYAIERLNRSINKALSSKKIQTQLVGLGYVMPPSINTPDVLETFLDDETEKWTSLLEAQQIPGLQ
jgi:tripartite-type tricarboxylate transporter receptor subunit TctC